MPHDRDGFWRGREFALLERMQVEAVRWPAEVADCGQGGAPFIKPVPS